jgi:FAD:protein FMN transferase
MTSTNIVPSPIHKKTMRLMGNRFEITVIDDNEEKALYLIDLAVQEIRRIEQLLTTFNDGSQTNQINKNAGIQPVQVNQEVFDLVERSVRLSHLTQGAFDLTYGSLDKRFWNFDQQMTSLPDAATAKEKVRLINFRNIMMDRSRHTIFLKEKGMRIGFGGIGKGYAAERAKQLLQQQGIKSGIVNAAGDLTTWGYQPDGKPWTIGIAAPDASRHPFSYLQISNMAVATSGNYEKYVWINGKKYSHTINPKTGYPVHGIKSVTIISPNAEIADAMTTPVMIMGKQVGLDLVNQVKGLACIIIDDHDKLYTSDNIKLT